MTTQNQYKPETVTHPGSTLQEKLEELGIGPKEFAIKADKPEKTISAILNGESSITSDMAVQFERVLGIPVKFWLQRQIAFDEYVARAKEKAKINEDISWIKGFPVKEMVKCNWLPDVQTGLEQAEVLLSFFGVASYSAWENYYLGQKLKVAFRISLAHTNHPQAIAAWLRRGEILASELSGPEYDKGVFENLLPELKKVMARQPRDCAKQIQRISLQAGVKVVYASCLPKAPISGATRWINDTPIIQLSGRYKKNDKFWFTFFHEAGHIVKHGKKDVFLEEVEYSDKDLDKEREADEFAIKWTFSHEQHQQVLENDSLSVSQIRDYAKAFGTHPAIIIGRLQHDGKIPYHIGTQLMEDVDIDF